MGNEKMMILNMLQEGKITAEEAAKLLAAAEIPDNGAPAAGTARPATPSSPRGTAADDGPVSNDGTRPAGAKPAGGVDFDELGRKFAAFAKGLEPKIQKVTEVVAEKTVTIADTLSKGIESTAASMTQSGGVTGTKPATKTAAPAGAGTERHIELVVADGYNELNLAGLNGEVNISGYNGDKISAKIRYKTRRNGAVIDLMKLGGKYYLNYEEDDFEFVAIDAYVPAHKFKVLNISGMNGNMDISGLSGDQMQISNSNGQTVLSDLTADSIKSESGNGRLTIGRISASTAIIEHFNGVLDASEVDAEKLSMTNFNGSLSMSVSAFERFNDYLWNVETSNGKLTFNVPTLPDLGYHVKASAPLGNIRVGLTGLEFSINDTSLVEARTPSFDSRSKKVRLALETSNAALTVN
ncbi:MAG: DUF4097 domain-containing protein [Defluviitaleaceae bacterium]|nr:DUF4097 domain-containing protein [Defluviitaleaceae bacterium]